MTASSLDYKLNTHGMKFDFAFRPILNQFIARYPCVRIWQSMALTWLFVWNFGYWKRNSNSVLHETIFKLSLLLQSIPIRMHCKYGWQFSISFTLSFHLYLSILKTLYWIFLGWHFWNNENKYALNPKPFNMYIISGNTRTYGRSHAYTICEKLESRWRNGEHPHAELAWIILCKYENLILFC